MNDEDFEEVKREIENNNKWIFWSAFISLILWTFIILCIFWIIH